MCSCLASSASLLKVFHIASVSGVISRVSRKAVALERGDSKAQGMLLGSGRHGGILAVGRRRGGLGNYLPFLSHLISSLVLFRYGQFYNPISGPPLRTRLPHLTSYQPGPSPSVVAVIDGCAELNKALVQCVGNCTHTFGHHHLGLSTAPLQTYNIPL